MALPDAVNITMDVLENSFIVFFVTHPTAEIPSGDVAIYGEILPPRPLLHDVETNKPATALVVKSIPGTRETDGGLRKPILLIRSYGHDSYSARTLSSLVEEVLHDQTFDHTDSSNTTHRIEYEMISGPNTGIETGTDFPYCDRLYSTAVM